MSTPHQTKEFEDYCGHQALQFVKKAFSLNIPITEEVKSAVFFMVYLSAGQDKKNMTPEERHRFANITSHEMIDFVKHQQRRDGLYGLTEKK
jgi:hypothetical protein